jgi:hypothetical protein
MAVKDCKQLFLRLSVLIILFAFTQVCLAGLYQETNCAGCHGQTGMGGLGPPLASRKYEWEFFRDVVRNGKGMMPATAQKDLSDDEIREVYEELQKMPWDKDAIPIAFEVGQLLSTKNVAIIFLFVFGISFLLSLKVLAYWLKVAGVAQLWPYIMRFGLLKSGWIALKSLVIDGFLVASLWRRSKHRWFMHGLMLYGMCGLVLADILMQIYNPTRGDLPLLNPLKLLPVVSGIAVLLGVFYVMYRYRTDRFIDNGLTLGRDFLFVNLLFHTVLSGFLSMLVNRLGISEYVMPIYIYHLCAIAILILSAPYTRFNHAFIVPTLVAITRVADAIAASGVDLGFRREPSPGRHHKTERMAHDLMKKIGVNESDDIRIRYYP